MPRKRTHEEFIKLMQSIHPNIQVLGTYKGGHIKIKCRCTIDGHIWEAEPASLLSGRGCPICGEKQRIQKQTKTHEQFIQELQEVNPDIEVLGTYVTNKTKIKVRCRLDGHEWETIPKSLLRGHGCHICGRKKADEQQRKTHEEFMKEFNIKNPHAKYIQIKGTYVGRKTKILCKCKIDEHEWTTRPNDLLNGQGCPKCGGTMKKTHEQFIKELQQINQDIEVLGTYVNSQTKIKCRCKIDGYEWETKPNALLNEHGCPKCGEKQKIQKLTKTHEEFIQELEQINTDIEVLGTYVNGQTKIKCKCEICTHEWEATPNDLLQRSGCPKCAGTMKLTHEEFINRMKKINSDIEILGTYVNSSTKIKCKCKICEHEWEATPNNLLRGSGCAKCKITKGEKRIAQYLDNLGIEYIYNMGYFNDLVSVNGGLMRPDFIIPSLKIWIEYDGIQHFEPVNFIGAMSEEQVQERFEYTQQNDQIKNQYAKDNNWTLIRIPYWDIDNIEQILDSYLKQEEELAL